MSESYLLIVWSDDVLLVQIILDCITKHEQVRVDSPEFLRSERISMASFVVMDSVWLTFEAE